MLAVVDHDGLHALVFPCRCGEGCWINVKTGLLIDVIPTHWREWSSDTSRILEGKRSWGLIESLKRVRLRRLWGKARKRALRRVTHDPWMSTLTVEYIDFVVSQTIGVGSWLAGCWWASSSPSSSRMGARSFWSLNSTSPVEC